MTIVFGAKGLAFFFFPAQFSGLNVHSPLLLCLLCTLDGYDGVGGI